MVDRVGDLGRSMTAIVAVPDVRRKRLVMGGDSAVSYDGDLRISATPKVRRAGGYLLGAAGDGSWFAMLSAVEWPAVPAVGYPELGLVRDLRDAAKRLGVDDADGSAILGAVIEDVPRLWTFESSLMIDAVPEGAFAAIGSGAAPALGVLWATRSARAEARTRMALEAAEAFRSDVRGPFTVLRY